MGFLFDIRNKKTNSNQINRKNKTEQKNLWNLKWFKEKWYFEPFDYYSLIILQLQTL